MSKPYPWARSMMLRRADAPDVYELEDKIRTLNRALEAALEWHVEGGKFTHVIPYMLFSTLEGYDREVGIAACLGFLKWLREDDKKHGIKRESLKGLRLPKEPKR